MRPAYEVTLRSALTLPDLPRTRDGHNLVIRLLNAARPRMPAGQRVQCELSGYGARLAWREVGTFTIRGANAVDVQPAPGATPELLRLFLLGAVSAVLFHRAGRLVLHGSAVVMQDAAVGLLGASGWGKSTLAGLLHQRGHRFLTDDVLAVDVEHGRTVAPGRPELKVWPDTAAALGHDP